MPGPPFDKCVCENGSPRWLLGLNSKALTLVLYCPALHACSALSPYTCHPCAQAVSHFCSCQRRRSPCRQRPRALQSIFRLAALLRQKSHAKPSHFHPFHSCKLHPNTGTLAANPHPSWRRRLPSPPFATPRITRFNRRAFFCHFRCDILFRSKCRSALHRSQVAAHSTSLFPLLLPAKNQLKIHPIVPLISSHSSTFQST